MNALDDWTSTASEALELDALDPAHRQLVLDLARDVAHGVLRPAAPLAAYLLGLAVGRGADPAAAAATLSDLATGWTSPTEESRSNERSND
jgi:hypothetical protein